MDTVSLALSLAQLRSLLGTPRAPLVLDVRRSAAFDADTLMIAGALRRDPEVHNAALFAS